MRGSRSGATPKSRAEEATTRRLKRIEQPFFADRDAKNCRLGEAATAALLTVENRLNATFYSTKPVSHTLVSTWRCLITSITTRVQ